MNCASAADGTGILTDEAWITKMAILDVHPLRMGSFSLILWDNVPIASFLSALTWKWCLMRKLFHRILVLAGLVLSLSTLRAYAKCGEFLTFWDLTFVSITADDGREVPPEIAAWASPTGVLQGDNFGSWMIKLSDPDWEVN